MILTECVGGPLDGQRIEARFETISVQPQWTGPFFGRHRYRLTDGTYVYEGLAATDYANAGAEPQEFKLPDNRRRR